MVLNNDDLNILKLNNNFAISTRPSFLELIARVEKAFTFSTLSSTQKDSINHPIANTVEFNSEVVSSNLSNCAKKCLKRLISNRNLVATKAYKVCVCVGEEQIVGLDKFSYLGKKSQQLIDEGNYH